MSDENEMGLPAVPTPQEIIKDAIKSLVMKYGGEAVDAVVDKLRGKKKALPPGKGGGGGAVLVLLALAASSGKKRRGGRRRRR